MGTASSEAGLSETALAERLRAAVAGEVPSIDIWQVYRRAGRLTPKARPPRVILLEEVLPDQGDWLKELYRPLPAAAPRQVGRARRFARSVMAAASRLLWELVPPVVVVGIAIPNLWVQIAALTLVAIAVAYLSSEIIDE